MINLKDNLILRKNFSNDNDSIPSDASSINRISYNGEISSIPFLVKDTSLLPNYTTLPSPNELSTVNLSNSNPSIYKTEANYKYNSSSNESNCTTNSTDPLKILNSINSSSCDGNHNNIFGIVKNNKSTDSSPLNYANINSYNILNTKSNNFSSANNSPHQHRFLNNVNSSNTILRDKLVGYQDTGIEQLNPLYTSSNNHNTIANTSSSSNNYNNTHDNQKISNSNNNTQTNPILFANYNSDFCSTPKIFNTTSIDQSYPDDYISIYGNPVKKSTFNDDKVIKTKDEISNEFKNNSPTITNPSVNNNGPSNKTDHLNSNNYLLNNDIIGNILNQNNFHEQWYNIDNHKNSNIIHTNENLPCKPPLNLSIFNSPIHYQTLPANNAIKNYNSAGYIPLNSTNNSNGIMFGKTNNDAIPSDNTFSNVFPPVSATSFDANSSIKAKNTDSLNQCEKLTPTYLTNFPNENFVSTGNHHSTNIYKPSQYAMNSPIIDSLACNRNFCQQAHPVNVMQHPYITPISQLSSDTLKTPTNTNCLNCGQIITTMWKKGGAYHLMCSSCGFVYKFSQSSKFNTPGKKKSGGKKKVGAYCINCFTTQTTLWRRNSDGESVCNACGLYYKLHKVNRPLSMKKSTLQTRNRKPRKKFEPTFSLK